MSRYDTPSTNFFRNDGFERPTYYDTIEGETLEEFLVGLRDQLDRIETLLTEKSAKPSEKRTSGPKN